MNSSLARLAPAAAGRLAVCARWMLPLLLTAGGLLRADQPLLPAVGKPSAGETVAVPRAPQVRELWTPANELETVLARYPRAVALTREQLESLLREARPKPPGTPEPPAGAVLRQARFDGRLVNGPDAAAPPQVRVTAELEVEVLSEQWAQVPLGLPNVALGTVEIDRDGTAAPPPGPASRRAWQPLEKAALVRIGPSENPTTALLIQGRGAHRLRLTFLLPVSASGGVSGITLPRPERAAGAVFVLHLPANMRVNCAHPFAVQPEVEVRNAAGSPSWLVLPPHTTLGGRPAPKIAVGSRVRVVLPAKDGLSKEKSADGLSWKAESPATGTGGFDQTVTLDYLAEETGVSVRMETKLASALGRLPESLRLPLPPGAGAVRVEGGAVRRWEIVENNALRIEPAPDDRGREASFTILFRLPLTMDAVTSLPLPEFDGAHGVTGQASVRQAPGLEVRRLDPGPALAPRAGLFGREPEARREFVAGFAVADLPQPGAVAPPSLTFIASKTAARFSVDADALADFQPTGVNIARTLTFHVEQGEIFSARATLPAGEELLEITQPDNPELDWRQEGGEAVISWNRGLKADAKTPTVLQMRSYASLKPLTAGQRATFEILPVTVRGAERLTGYVALKSAPAFRLTAEKEERLERRDGRTTPVRGDIAWFYREDFRLAVRVERVPAQVEAGFVGYALPLAGAVEINAQIRYRFLFSGMESVRVRVPRETANAFYFTGDHIAERKLDDDVWTIRFQGERTGDYALGIRATLPCLAQKDDAARFHFRLPAVTPLDVPRWSGTWAVEANTDTEIQFAVEQANEADALRAPELAGYQPKSRVIGVFDFIGGSNPAIDLDGVRHPAAGSAAAVVDDLNLTTQVSTSGAVRHHATILARTAGDQFFNVRLPEGAAIWSLLLDGDLIKPVGGPAGELRVELPGGRPPQSPSRVEIVYETRGKSWASAGRQGLEALRFDKDVPVLKSRWQLYLPDGFTYRGFDSDLTPQASTAEGLLFPWLGKTMLSAVSSFILPTFNSVQVRGKDRTYSYSAPMGGMARESNMAAPMSTPQATTAAPVVMLPQSPAAAGPAPDSAAVSPKFIDKVQSVKQLFIEAQGFFDSARYDLAFKRYEQILALDPTNIAARRGQERINKARLQYVEQEGAARSRSQSLWEVSKAWERPVRRYGLEADPKRGIRTSRDDSNTASINRKLSAIIIPNIEFRQTPIRDAIEFLRQEARRLDTTSPPEERGFSIFLKLPADGSGPSEDTRITLTLTNIPLLEALRYVASQAGMKVKVEPYAVSLVPITEATDALVTAEIPVTAAFFGTVSMARGGDATGATRSAADDQRAAKESLEPSGVTFPPGASVVYQPSTGKLIVRNTQENIDLIQSLVDGADGTRNGASVTQSNTTDVFLFDGPQFQVVTGLMPIKLDLPANGRRFEFSGDGEPGRIGFRYVDWRTGVRWRWAQMTLGALAFLFFAAPWTRPWRRLLVGVLALTFFPLIVAPSATALCNTLLAGWLLAALGWMVTRLLLRHKRRAVRAMPAMTAAMCFFAALLPSNGHAAEPSSSPTALVAPTAPEVVIVPYDASKPLNDQKPDRLYLPYERFLELWDAAKRHRQPPLLQPPPGGARHALNAAIYTGRIVGDVLQIEGNIDLQTFTRDGEWERVPLDFTGLQLAGLTLDDAPATLDEGALWVGTPGAHRATVSLRLPAPRLTAGSRLEWTLPRTAATMLTVLFPQPELRAAIESAAGSVEEIVPEGRRVTAMLGLAGRVVLSFRAAPPTAPAAASQPALANLYSRLVVRDRREAVHADLVFSFSGGSQEQFTVYLDSGLTLIDLSAPDVKTWRLAPSGDRQALEITLNAPARDEYRLSLDADRPLGNLPAAGRRYPYLSAQASRVERAIALAAEDPVEISLPNGAPAGYRRVDRSRANAADGQRVFGAYEIAGELSPAEGLVYSVRPVVERREAHLDYLYQVSKGKIELAAAVQLSVPTGAGPLMTAELRLPGDFAIQAVEGRSIKTWRREGDVLALRFHTPEAGEENEPRALLVYLVRQFERPPESFALRPMAPVGFAETRGEAVVAADRSFRVGLTLPADVRARDLSEIDAQPAAAAFRVSLPLERQRAFRYRGSEFEATARLEAQSARWEAGWVSHATAGEGLISLQTRVNVEVRQGTVETLEFSLPASAPEARVAGPEIREVTSSAPANGGGRRVYRVAFQNAVYAETGFTIDLELPLAAGGKAALPDLAFPSAEARVSPGFLLVENASLAEMSLNARELDSVTAADVPFLPAQVAAGARFFRAAPGAGWSLEIQLTNLEKTAGRAALVAYAQLTSALRPGGEEWHRAVYRLQNRRLQFLPVELPPGTEFIGARVAGESVRVDAGQAEGKPVLLVPLLKTRPGEISYDVELIYRRPPGHALRTLARRRLDDPRLPGIPIEKTLWDVYLPGDFRVVSSGGNVEPALAALNEAEKLDSAINDLRSLSATIMSMGASAVERDRALSNYHGLQQYVAKAAASSAQGEQQGQADVQQDELKSLKSDVVRSQSGQILQKRAQILNEANSLDMQVQKQNALPQTANEPQQSFADAAKSMDERALAGANTYNGATTVNGGVLKMPSADGGWRDNRGAARSGGSGGGGGPFPSKDSPVPRQPQGKGQLALNDQVSVDLPGMAGKGDKVAGEKKKEAEPSDSKRLSTARAVQPADAAYFGTFEQRGSGGGAGGSARQLAKPDGKPSSGAAPGSDRAESLPARPVIVAKRMDEDQAPAKTALRSTGRVSLTVEFPSGGQVYHFKKIKGDAELTFWLARPGDFERLKWLGLLGAIVLLGRLRSRRQRRSATSAPVSQPAAGV